MTVASVGKPKDSGVPGEPEDMHNPATSENHQTESAEQGYFDEVVELFGPPTAVLDQLHRILSANSRFCDLCGTVRASLIGKHIRDVCNGILYAPAMQEALRAFESDRPSETQHRKQIDLPLTGGQTLAVTIRGLPGIFPTARVLLVADRSDERAARKSQRDLVHGTDLLGPLSAETLRHDIRQPLQTLSLLQGVLAMKEDDPTLRGHLTRLHEAIEALGGMLDILEDLQRPSVSPAVLRFVGFPIDPVLNRLRSEFGYHAEAKGLKLTVLPCRAVVHSDPPLLQQVIRALLLAAMRMISRGKVLLGCRRRRGKLSIEVWIGGEPIASGQQQNMLDEFHRSAALPNEKGIVHSIVKPFSDALGLSVKARSRPGTGLLFTADVPMSPVSQSDLARDGAGIEEATTRGAVAVVSDNLSDHEALLLLLRAAGYQVFSVRHEAGTVELEPGDGMQPEVIVADFSRLADGAANRLVRELRNRLGPHTPAVVIADEAWSEAQSRPISEPVTYLGKPATAEEITTQVLQALIAARDRLAVPRSKDRHARQQTTFIVDDDRLLRDAMSGLLTARGQNVEVHSSAESFLASYTPLRRGCLVLDDKLPGLRGVELLEKLRAEGVTLPAIMITGHGDIETAVRAMRVGSVDYIEKPVLRARLLSAIDRALEIDKESADSLARQQQLAARFATLTRRERQVLDLVVKGASSKSIARVLNISQRTVENHRAAVMKRMGATSLSDLIRAVMELRPSQEP